MKIKVIAFGKLKNPGLRLAADHYSAFIRSFAEFSEIELRPERVEEKSLEVRNRIQNKETETLLEKLGDTRNRPIVILDERGKGLTTLQWSEWINTQKNQSISEIIFVIGSSLGFSNEIRKRAALVVSLGSQTMPHELARVVLIEQIARALSVIAKHPYHHEG